MITAVPYLCPTSECCERCTGCPCSAHSPDASASGNDIFGFFPLFVLALGGPLNLIGIIVASSRAKEKPAKWKLNRLGIILNASPYVIFFVIMFVGLAVAPFFS